MDRKKIVRMVQVKRLRKAAQEDSSSLNIVRKPEGEVDKINIIYLFPGRNENIAPGFAAKVPNNYMVVVPKVGNGYSAVSSEVLKIINSDDKLSGKEFGRKIIYGFSAGGYRVLQSPMAEFNEIVLADPFVAEGQQSMSLQIEKTIFLYNPTNWGGDLIEVGMRLEELSKNNKDLGVKIMSPIPGSNHDDIAKQAFSFISF